MGSSGGIAGGTTSLNLLDVGEEVIPRQSVSSEIAPDSGTVFLSYWTARKSEPITSLLSGTGGNGTTTPTLCRIGIYSATGGTLTLVASTANITTLWGAGFTTYTPALQATWNKVAGQRYAVGFLCIATGMPLIECCPVRYHSSGKAPKIQGEFTGQSNLPASIPEASLGNGYRMFQCLVLP